MLDQNKYALGAGLLCEKCCFETCKRAASSIGPFECQVQLRGVSCVTAESRCFGPAEIALQRLQMGPQNAKASIFAGFKSARVFGTLKRAADVLGSNKRWMRRCKDGEPRQERHQSIAAIDMMDPSQTLELESESESQSRVAKMIQ